MLLLAIFLKRERETSILVKSLIRFSIILQFFKRERETFPQEKKQLDDKLNDALKNCKRHGYVTNLMFQKIHENVGIIGKRHMPRRQKI